MNSEERAAKKRENVKKWKAANPEKVREQRQRYYLRHREKRLVYMRQYSREMREKARQFDEKTGGAEE